MADERRMMPPQSPHINGKVGSSQRSRLISFKYAIRGVWIMLKSQQNARIHLLATLVVLGLGFYFRLKLAEWCWIILAISIVWIAEALNTALEFLTDVASPEFHPLAEKAKDVSAGAVLISALAALSIGIIIFSSYFIRLL
ncbi:MAG: diacylglycerol kinase family protein [Candidatus Sumerlaeia bacterium]|nr:diacylglycerol kinase family protein [Candidatus Sumerlaeia bacterium]